MTPQLKSSEWANGVEVGGNIVDLLEPDVFIMGVGVAPMLNPFFGEIQRALPAWCMNKRCVEIPIVPAHYGAESRIARGRVRIIA